MDGTFNWYGDPCETSIPIINVGMLENNGMERVTSDNKKNSSHQAARKKLNENKTYAC
jgi:hypothetical protein